MIEDPEPAVRFRGPAVRDLPPEQQAAILAECDRQELDWLAWYDRQPADIQAVRAQAADMLRTARAAGRPERGLFLRMFFQPAAPPPPPDTRIPGRLVDGYLVLDRNR